MEKTSWRTRGLEWFTSHALWELAKFASVALFAWLISFGYARMMNAALGTAFNIFLILIGIVGLLWALGLIPALRKPAHGLDREKLSELRTRGHQLLSSTPRAGASPSDLIRFWDEEIGLWTSATATLLVNTLGNDASEFFLSTTGLNYEQTTQQILSEAKNSHLRLGRWLQNLEQLRQTLPKK